MAWVTQQMIDVWNSGELVGANTPHAVVQVQIGHWVPGWYGWESNPDPLAFEPVIHAQVWGEGSYGGKPPSFPPEVGNWGRKWYPTYDVWFTVPNLTSIKRSKDLAQNGITVLEVVVDALDYEPKTGALGDAYHVLVPGALAPDRSYIGPTRPDPGWDLTPWAPAGQYSRLTDSVAIRVWQGYGPPETDDAGNTPAIDGGSNGAWTFRGMIDDVDIDGEPNQITITARNGKLLTDVRCYQGGKSTQIKDPITFYDSNAAVQPKIVGSGALGSSHSDADHRAKNVLDTSGQQWDLNAARYDTVWESGGNIDADTLEWVEIRVPQGRYSSIWLQTEPGLQAYVAVYAQPLVFWDSTGFGYDQASEVLPPTRNDSPVDPGWQGAGAAPGAHGGWSYVTALRTGTTLPARYRIGSVTLDRISLGGEYEFGKHSIIRVGFTRPSGTLAPVRVGELHGLQRVVQRDILQQQFILVDDASEIVKVALRWAGYHQWDVDQANVRLSDGTNYGPGVVAKSAGRLTFNRTQALMEIISEVGKQLGWTFFITDPVDANSEGLPTFRRDSSLLTDNHYIAAELDESNMLTGLKRKNSDENKATKIRIRGKTASARGGGIPDGGESVRRITAIYHTPWEPYERSGGIERFLTFQDDQLTTYAMCLYGCLLWGMNAALAMHTAIVEIPAYPLLELDDQVSILDEPTATNSRLWIVKTDDTMMLGQDASWKQTLEGSLLDTRDLQEIIAQSLGDMPARVGRPGIPWFVDIPSIDWNAVADPAAPASISSYPAPVTKGKTRTPRKR